jgi:hypothetical protein
VITEKKYIIVDSDPKIVLDNLTDCIDYAETNSAIGEFTYFQEILKYTKE